MKNAIFSKLSLLILVLGMGLMISLSSCKKDKTVTPVTPTNNGNGGGNTSSCDGFFSIDYRGKTFGGTRPLAPILNNYHGANVDYCDYVAGKNDNAYTIFDSITYIGIAKNGGIVYNVPAVDFNSWTFPKLLPIGVDPSNTEYEFGIQLYANSTTIVSMNSGGSTSTYYCSLDSARKDTRLVPDVTPAQTYYDYNFAQYGLYQYIVHCRANLLLSNGQVVSTTFSSTLYVKP